MLKTSGSTESSTRPGKGEVGVGGDSRAELDGSKVDSGEVGDDEVGKKVQNSSKSKKSVRSDFLTSGAKLAFAELRQAFVKAPILHHFDPERHIQIETDVSGYAIGGVQKLQRSEKIVKAIGSDERLPKHQSSVKELELPLELWQFFELFLLGPEALSIPRLERLPTRQS